MLLEPLNVTIAVIRLTPHPLQHQHHVPIRFNGTRNRLPMVRTMVHLDLRLRSCDMYGLYWNALLLAARRKIPGEVAVVGKDVLRLLCEYPTGWNPYSCVCEGTPDSPVS